MFRTVPLHCVPFKVFILSLMCYPHVQYKATASLHSPGRPFPSPALPSIPLPLNPFLSSPSSVHLPSSPFSSIPLSLTPFLSSITASLSLPSSPSLPQHPLISLTPLSFPYSFPISLFLSLLPLLSPASLYISLLSLPPLTVSHSSPAPSLPSLPLQSSTLSPLLSFPLPMSPYPQYIFPFISLPDLT